MLLFFFFFFLLFFCYRRPLLIKTKRQGARQQPGRSRDLNAGWAVVLFCLGQSWLILKVQKPLQEGWHLLLERINPDPSQGWATSALLAFSTRCAAPARTHTRKTSTDGRGSASALFSRVRRVSARLLPPQRAEHGPTAPLTPAVEPCPAPL